MIPRIFDVAKENQCILQAIDGYQNSPLLPLKEAVQPVKEYFDAAMLERNVWIAQQRNQGPLENLTLDESASILLYTMEWNTPEESFYYLLNEVLRKESRGVLRPWYNYLKLLLSALYRLPPVRRTIFRGIKRDLSAGYPMGATGFWWGFSSCTNSMDVLQKQQFCGQTGLRTMFLITCETGRSIKHHSCFSDEDEILLMPGFHYEVKGNSDMGNGLRFIHLTEIQPPHRMLSLPEQPGIFIETTCRTPTCSNNNRLVRVLFGMCSLNLVSDLDEGNCYCPFCKHYVEPNKYGLLNCWWRWSARRREAPGTPPRDCSYQWARADGAVYFSPNDREDASITWLRLIIEARDTKPQ